MRILCVLCRDPFREQDGGSFAIRSSLRALASRGDIYLVGFGASFDQPSLCGYRCLGSLGASSNSLLSFMASLATATPYSLKKYAGSLARTRFSQVIGTHNFDVVWYEQTQAAAAAYYSGVLLTRRDKLLHVLRSHNVEHELLLERFRVPGWARAVLKWEAFKFKRTELEIIRSVDRVLTISEEDRAAFVKQCSEVSPRISYCPVPVEPINVDIPALGSERRTVLFVGKATWEPNRQAAMWIIEQLAPALEKILPEFKIRLVGASTDTLARYIVTDNVRCLGYVNNIETEYAKALCTLAPLRSGGGVNIKVIDSLAHGIPVIGTCFASRGIQNDAFLLAETAEEFASSIQKLANDPKLVSSLSLTALTRSKSGPWGEEGWDALWTNLIDARGSS